MTDARLILETLGKSHIGITRDGSAHVMSAMQRDAADRMDAMLGGAAWHR